MKKRILLISPSELCVGGVSSVIMTIVKELHEEYVFDVAALSGKCGYFDETFEAYGGTVFRIPSIQYLEHKILHPLSFFQIQRAITRILNSNKYDVIHCHSGYLDAACQYAAARAGVPIRISHGHGTYLWKGYNLFMRFYFWFAKKIIRKYATKRLACSDIAGNTLFLGENYDNISNPVDVSKYADIEKEPHKGINLLQIGYFCKRKNQMFTVNLLDYLRKCDVDAHLFLIGYPNEEKYLEQLNDLIEKNELWEHVSFLPHDFDKRIAFAKTDYCVLPSASEGLPLVALESQAAGVPCLMSNNISTDSDIGAGYFLPHNDCKQWADTIVRGVQIDSNRLADNLNKKSIPVYAEKIRKIYEQKD